MAALSGDRSLSNPSWNDYAHMWYLCETERERERKTDSDFVRAAGTVASAGSAATKSGRRERQEVKTME